MDRPKYAYAYYHVLGGVIFLLAAGGHIFNILTILSIEALTSAQRTAILLPHILHIAAFLTLSIGLFSGRRSPVWVLPLLLPGIYQFYAVVGDLLSLTPDSPIRIYVLLSAAAALLNGCALLTGVIMGCAGLRWEVTPAREKSQGSGGFPVC